MEQLGNLRIMLPVVLDGETFPRGTVTDTDIFIRQPPHILPHFVIVYNT